MKKILLSALLLFGFAYADIQYYNEPIKTVGTTADGHIIKVALVDDNGTTLEYLNGTVPIHDADAHRAPINEFFWRYTGADTNLSSPISSGDTNITVDSVVGFSVGNDIRITNGVTERTFQRITSIVSNTLVLDRPIDNDFSIGDEVHAVTIDMSSTAGTLASPVSYKIIPDAGEEWHIIRFLTSMVHSSAADDSLFGNLAALTNGVCFRIYNGTTGKFRTFTNWKRNADIKLDMYDITYTDKAGGGNFGTGSRGSIKLGSGAAPVIVADNGDYIEMLIQDNLTALGSFSIKVQGHIKDK